MEGHVAERGSSLTQVFPTSSNTSEDYSTLQGRLTALSDLHNKATAELAAKDNEIISLQTRLSNLAQDSQSSLAALAKGKNDAERELRWAREGRQSAERREELAKRELELLRTAKVSTAYLLPPLLADQGKASGFPGSSSGGDQSARVKELESLIDTYKAELEAISRDSQEVEERITQGAGLVKQSELESAQSRIAQLQTGQSESTYLTGEVTIWLTSRYHRPRIYHLAADLCQQHPRR